MTAKLRTSLRLNNDLTVDEFVALCRRAEECGFDQVWVSNDLYLRSAPVMLTAAALATERIGLGVGLMNPYSVHPSEIAMMTATLQEVSQGRFLLGLGAGAEEFLAWAGIERPRPLTHTRRATREIRALLAGGRSDGTDGRSPHAYLRFAAQPAPIYLGAMSPKMLAMTGAIADGALPLLYPPEHYEAAAAQIVDGAVAAGREPSEIDIAACIWVSVARDEADAIAPLAEKIAYYGASFAPYLLARAGLGLADFEPIQRALHETGIERARDLVTPAMLRLGIAGTPDQVVERCAGLLRSGVRHLSFGPPLGPDVLAAVDILGDEVLPALARAEGAQSRKQLDDMRSGALDIAAHARSVAERLVGLPIEQARARAQRDGQVVLREITTRGQPVTADFRANRITLLVDDGTVVEAHGGS